MHGSALQWCHFDLSQPGTVSHLYTKGGCIMETANFQVMIAKHGRRIEPIVLLSFYHIGALFAPFFFTWEGFWIGLVLYFLTGIAISVGFHRLFNHRSFKTYRVVRWVFALIGGLAGEAHVRWWVLMHRMHHQWADQERDPHSPVHGFWWSHFLWTMVRIPQDEMEKLERRFIPDLLKDPVLLRICRWEVPLHILLALSLLCGGWVYGGWFMGLSWLFWAFCLRIVLVLHLTWSVNSVTHKWGYRNYETKDTSRNVPIFAFVTIGEWLHNNHHHAPSAANFSRRWWEIDPGYHIILLLSWCGLAWDIKKEEDEEEDEEEYVSP